MNVRGWSMLSLGVLASCGCDDPDLLILAMATDPADITITDSGTLERTVDVFVNGNIVRASAEVIVEHERPDDLVVTLTSPMGTPVDLGGRLADGCDFYRFAIPLLALQGEPGAGTWRLTIQDQTSGIEGRLVTWGLSFEALDTN